VIPQPPLWSSDNEWDIPSLLPDLQGVPVVPPVVSWGTVSRLAHMPGTWVFYVDDTRFSRALRDAVQLSGTGCNSAAELNISVFDSTPMAEALWAIYRKRYAARSWQELGIRVLGDLNGPERYLRLNLLGVPKGWRAYATRGYQARPDSLETEWAVMREWSCGTGTLLVYGGGQKIREMCLGLDGTVWIPDHMAEFRARKASAS
jgi:hypothetical protein